jgi:hypothetical protein
MTYPDNDIDYYDNDQDEMSHDEAIEMLMEEGYSEEEAERMIGDHYDPDEYEVYEHDDDIPEMADIVDWADEEDFD